MRFGRNIWSVIAAGFLIAPSAVPASVIFSTGEGPSVASGLLFDGGHWRALNFTLSERSTITDIEGWMFVLGGTNYTVGLYDGSTGVPGASLLSVAATTTAGTLGWVGAHGLALTLDPGSYWAAFEDLAGDNMVAAFPSGAPTAIASAFGFGNGSYCCVEFGLRMGLRIQGELAPTAVPEPATLTLVGIGVGALGYKSKRRRREASSV